MKLGRMMTAEEERILILSNGGKPEEVWCATCGERHYQGKGYYPLRRVRGYEMWCCKACYDGNWNTNREKKILANLEKKEIEPPPRNENGLLPFSFEGQTYSALGKKKIFPRA